MSKAVTPSLEEKAIVEAILFASPRPVTIESIQELTGHKPRYIEGALVALAAEYEERGINIREVAGGWQMVTAPRAAAVIEKLHGQAARAPLTRAALETLAVIAYKQPVTRAYVESVRGVKVDHIIRQLLDRNFVREVGRSEALGKPALLGTTRQFLTWFGLKNLEALPPLPNLAALEEADHEALKRE